MAIQTWKTPLEVLGLATYLTIMTGSPPDRELLAAARGTRPVEAHTGTRSSAKTTAATK